MKNNIIRLFLLFTVSMFADIKTELSSYQIITDKNGTIERVSAEEGSPGDILEYVFYIKNEEKEIIYNLNPIIPIPEGTTMLKESLVPKNNFKVSLNGRDYLEFPIKKDGINIPLESYRAVMWDIPQLNIEKEIELKLQVKINTGN